VGNPGKLLRGIKFVAEKMNRAFGTRQRDGAEADVLETEANNDLLGFFPQSRRPTNWGEDRRVARREGRR